MQKHVLVNLVDLVLSNEYFLAKFGVDTEENRTSPIKFAHLAEKSEKRSISNLSTKGDAGHVGRGHARARPPLGPISLFFSQTIVIWFFMTSFGV